MSLVLYIKLQNQIQRQNIEVLDYQDKALVLAPVVALFEQELNVLTQEQEELQKQVTAAKEKEQDTTELDTLLTDKTTAKDQKQQEYSAKKSELDNLNSIVSALVSNIETCTTTKDSFNYTSEQIQEYLTQESNHTNQLSEQHRVEQLWKAAHEYEFTQISGSAIGLLAMGVMMGKPKCLAVQNWIKSIWTIYYTRKATGETSTDYSSAGTIPHTVPELMQELGV